MLRVDLVAAKIEYEDASGRTFDFHALRGQFAASLARAGVHPRVAQLLLRHSKADLTMSVYSHLALVDLRGGLDALPPLPSPGGSPDIQRLAATGTDRPASACTKLAQTPEIQCEAMMGDETTEAKQPAHKGRLSAGRKSLRLKAVAGDCEDMRLTDTNSRAERAGFSDGWPAAHSRLQQLRE